MFAIFSSCTAKAQSAAAPEDLTKVFADAGLRLLKERIAARDFTLPLAQTEGTQSLSGLKGKVVFLNFWATWCGPCRSEMPSMEALYNRFKDKGFVIFAVNSGEGRDEVVSFMKNNNLTFPAALDSDGKVNGSYGIQAIPTTFLIDREGNIILRLVGSIDWNTPKVQAAMEKLLGEK